jgi:hypothetical protein
MNQCTKARSCEPRFLVPMVSMGTHGWEAPPPVMRGRASIICITRQEPGNELKDFTGRWPFPAFAMGSSKKRINPRFHGDKLVNKTGY